jgi:hypothetical protein
MPAKAERYRFVPFEVEDVNAVPQTLLGGYAEVTRGGGMTFERVVLLGPDGTSRAELHLKRGHVKKLGRLALFLVWIRQSRHDRLWSGNMCTFKLRHYLLLAYDFVQIVW